MLQPLEDVDGIRGRDLHLAESRGRMKRLREAFSAETLLAEARRSTVTSAVIVHHMFQHGLVQPHGLIVRFGLLVVIRARANWQRRYLCENGVVNLVGTGEAELAIEDTQDVTVRQATRF